MAFEFIDDIPLDFTTWDTAYCPQVNLPWGTNTATITSAVFDLYTLDTVEPVSPFTGQGATVTQTTTSGTLQYTWPSVVEAGYYAARFRWTDNGGATGSTDWIYVTVTAP